MAPVRVFTAGKHEATREVGEAIAARLREHGHDALALAAADPGGLDDGCAVVLGSAIYMGRWLKPARKLAGELASEEEARPLWLFSVGPVGDPPVPEPPPAADLAGAGVADRARGYKTFSGRLERDGLGRLERVAVNAQDAPEGDFRDWAAIEAWADQIAAELGESPSG